MLGVRLDAHLQREPPVLLDPRPPKASAAAKDDSPHPAATSAVATVVAPPAAAGAERVADCRNNNSPTGKCAVDGVEFACVLLPPGLDSPDPRPPMKGAARTIRPAAGVCRVREKSYRRANR